MGSIVNGFCDRGLDNFIQDAAVEVATKLGLPAESEGRIEHAILIAVRLHAKHVDDAIEHAYNQAVDSYAESYECENCSDLYRQIDKIVDEKDNLDETCKALREQQIPCPDCGRPLRIDHGEVRCSWCNLPVSVVK